MAVSSEPQIFLHAVATSEEARPARTVIPFDYSGEAELFPPRSRKYPRERFGYRRFALAADAVRFAIEELPPELLVGAILEVDGERYGANKLVAYTTPMIFPCSGAKFQ
jgi:hypothetical protein